MFVKNIFIVIGLALLVLACGKKLQMTNNSTNHNNNASQLDSNLEQKAAFYRKGLEVEMNTKVCFSDTSWLAVRPESNLGSWAADAVLWQAKQYDSVGPHIALMNKGGLRSALPKGNITVGNFFELMPFENKLCKVKIHSDSLQKMLIYLKNKGGEPFAGFVFYLEPLLAKYIDTKNNITLGKLPWIVTSDYLANGGDYMSFFNNPIKRKNYALGIRQTFINYAKFQGTLRISELRRWNEKK